MIRGKVLSGGRKKTNKEKRKTLNPDTPKRIPITLSDTHYGHTQEDTHYT